MQRRTPDQTTIDRIVYSYTSTLLLALIGMFFDIALLTVLSVPVIFALLLYLSVSDLPSEDGKTRAMWAIHAFNIVSFGLWIVVFAGLQSEAQWLAGLPISTAIVYFFIWPYYSIFGGLLYAYVAEIGGILKSQQQLEEQDAAAA